MILPLGKGNWDVICKSIGKKAVSQIGLKPPGGAWYGSVPISNLCKHSKSWPRQRSWSLHIHNFGLCPFDFILISSWSLQFQHSVLSKQPNLWASVPDSWDQELNWFWLGLTSAPLVQSAVSKESGVLGWKSSPSSLGTGECGWQRHQKRICGLGIHGGISSFIFCGFPAENLSNSSFSTPTFYSFLRVQSTITQVCFL